MAEWFVGCSQEGKIMFSSPLDAANFTPALRQQSRLICAKIHKLCFCVFFACWMICRSLTRVFSATYRWICKGIVLCGLTLSDPTSELVRHNNFLVLLRRRKTSDTCFVAFLRPLSEPVRRFASCSTDFTRKIAQVVLFLFVHVYFFKTVG
jgi:hypothetical protein